MRLKHAAAAAAAAAGLFAMAASATGTAPSGPITNRASVPTRHTLTIISAFSCPYCRVLDAQGIPAIQAQWMSRGLAVESVPVTISATDLPATIAATCGSDKDFLRRSTIIFRSQSSIVSNWGAADAKQKEAAEKLPNGAGADRMAHLAGIYDIAPSIGLTMQQLHACLNDPARQRYVGEMDRLSKAKWNVVGTPTVLLDGRRIDNTWPAIQTELARTFAK